MGLRTIVGLCDWRMLDEEAGNDNSLAVPEYQDQIVAIPLICGDLFRCDLDDKNRRALGANLYGILFDTFDAAGLFDDADTHVYFRSNKLAPELPKSKQAQFAISIGRKGVCNFNIERKFTHFYI